MKMMKLNGVALARHLHTCTCNVFPSSPCQDDVVMGTLSVRENLQFSAALRLPSHMSSSQRRERVERVIQELGLSKCADTKVT